MRHMVLLVAVVVGALACNPTARCKASADCGPGVCSGGFCTDVASELMTPDAGRGGASDGGEATRPIDADDPDAGVVTDAGSEPVADAGDNGRP